MSKAYIHPTAEVSKDASLGENVKVWHQAVIREHASLGDNCIVSKGVYIDHHVKIGNNVKIQNNVSLYFEAIIEDGVFIGPHVILTNDKIPRAIDEKGNLKGASDWKAHKTTIKKGASIGAGSILLPGITIGEYAMIGAGSLVTKNVPDFALVYGCPAMIKGRVDKAGNKIEAE